MERTGESKASELPTDREQELKRADLQRGLESVCVLHKKESEGPATPVVLQQAIVGLSNLPVSRPGAAHGGPRCLTWSLKGWAGGLGVVTHLEWMLERRQGSSLGDERPWPGGDVRPVRNRTVVPSRWTERGPACVHSSMRHCIF